MRLFVLFLLLVQSVEAARYVWIRPHAHRTWMLKPVSWDGSDGGWVLVPERLANQVPISDTRPHVKIRKHGKTGIFAVCVHPGSNAIDVASALQPSLPRGVNAYAIVRKCFRLQFAPKTNQTVIDRVLGMVESRPEVYLIHERHKIVLHTVFASSDVLGIGPPDVLLEGNNITVLVGDTGLYRSHCMFSNGLTVPQGLLGGSPITLPDTGSKIRGYISLCLDSGCSTTTDYTDVSNGHGTHVCGIALGAECGVKYGVLPSARCVFVDMSTTSDGIDLPISLAAMFESGAAMGASASTFSWGSTANDGSYEIISSDVDDSLYANPTWVAAVAAGNAGDAGGSGSDPATAKNVLSVGATMLGSQAYAAGDRGYDPTHVATYPYLYDPTSIASFTSIGPWADGRRGPLVCAPGVAVLSAAAGTTSGFILMTGTSMASPAVPLGAVQARLRDALGAGMPRSSMVRAAIIATAYDPLRVVTLYSSTVQPDASQSTSSRCAFGVVNVNPLLETTTWMAAPVSLSASQYVCVVAAGSTVTAAVSWNEPSAIPGSTQPVLNKIQLWALNANDTTMYDQDVLNYENHRRVRLTNISTGNVIQIGLNPAVLSTGTSVSLDLFVFNATAQVPCPVLGCVPQPCGAGDCMTVCPNSTCVCAPTSPPTINTANIVLATDLPEFSYVLVLVVSLEIILALTLFGAISKQSQSVWSVLVLASFLIFVFFAVLSGDMDKTTRLDTLAGLYALLVITSFGALASLPEKKEKRNVAYEWFGFIVVLWICAMFVIVLSEGFFQAAGLFTLLTAIMIFALGYAMAPLLTVFIALLFVCFYAVVVAATIDMDAPYAGLYLAGCVIAAVAAAGGVADLVFEQTRRQPGDSLKTT